MTPVASQQVVTLMLDMFMAGKRIYPPVPKLHPYGTDKPVYARVPLIPPEPGAKILMYIMPHFPGNTANSWRRQFYGDLAHGLQIASLFCFDTSFSGYTQV